MNLLVHKYILSDGRYIIHILAIYMTDLTFNGSKMNIPTCNYVPEIVLFVQTGVWKENLGSISLAKF